MPTAKSDQTKQKEEQLKDLRKELEEKILEQLPESESARLGGPEVRQFEDSAKLDELQAKRVIEAVLFAASKPMALTEFKRILKGYSAQAIEEILRALAEEYQKDGRSFRIHEIAGGFEVSSEPEYAPWILKMELQKKAKQATQSALETLAILAYKQPVTRAEVEDLRGVDVSGVISTLLERNLICIVGRKEVPGRPFLYGTTEKFLEHFGLKSLQDLPNISEIKSLVETSIRKDDLFQSGKTIAVESAQDESQIPSEISPSEVSSDQTDDSAAEENAS